MTPSSRRYADPTKPSQIRDADKETADLIEKFPYVLVDAGLGDLDPDGEELTKKRDHERAKSRNTGTEE